MLASAAAHTIPYLWVDATCVPCRKNGHGATAAVVTAIVVDEDGVRRVVCLACVDAEFYESWKGFLCSEPWRLVRDLRRPRRHRAGSARPLRQRTRRRSRSRGHARGPSLSRGLMGGADGVGSAHLRFWAETSTPPFAILPA